MWGGGARRSLGVRGVDCALQMTRRVSVGKVVHRGFSKTGGKIPSEGSDPVRFCILLRLMTRIESLFTSTQGNLDYSLAQSPPLCTSFPRSSYEQSMHKNKRHPPNIRDWLQGKLADNAKGTLFFQAQFPLKGDNN